MKTSLHGATPLTDGDGISNTVAESAQRARYSDSQAAGRLVDSLNGVFGKQTCSRAIHAKGIVLEGVFNAEPIAATLSKAPHFKGDVIPVTVRFSDFAGIPTVADNDGLATPRGMAVKFHLPGGLQTDIVAHSVNGFPAATAEEFRQLMVAIGSSGPGTSRPTPAERFMADHGAAKAFFDNLPGPPISFATVSYFGVNSFKFTNIRDETRFGRYQIVPGAGTHFLSKAAATTAEHDYLTKELTQRLASQPLRFTVQVQLATPGDVVGNPSIAWRDANPTVSMGTLTITQLAADSDQAEQRLLFTPAALSVGIEPADAMIGARDSAYRVSYARRHGSQ
jgi:catalase